MRTLLTLMLCLAGFTAQADVLLIQGTSSTPNAAERNYAASVTRNLSRWLTEIGIAHRLLTDDELCTTPLAENDIVILGYNPQLPDRENSVLTTFANNGGRMIVFYSVDQELAELLGVRLGPYIAEDRPGRWSAFRFNTNAPPHMPEAVFQHSRNIRPVYPVSPRTHIIARWEGANSSTPGEPAWVRTLAGFWMTHVLRADGDERRKKAMLLSLLADCNPLLWKPAAQEAMRQAPRLSSATTLPEAKALLKDTMAPLRDPAETDRTLARIDVMDRRMQALWDRDDFPGVIAAANALQQRLTETYAEAQPPGHDELRGVWDHTGTGLYPGDWKKTCELLSRQGITDLFVDLCSAGTAHYASDVLPRSPTFELLGDQAQQCVEAAHAHGIRIHAWKICWKLIGAPADAVAAFKADGRLQQSDKGKVLQWLCPSDPRNLAREKDALRELVTRYEFDGVHLDYIRYPGSHSCFCPACRSRFEKHHGARISDWPHAAAWGKERATYASWRRSNITRLVQDVHTGLRRHDPDIILSAAVYGKYPSCANSVAQDWVSWVHDGYLDYVCPMNYTADTRQFSQWLSEQISLVPHTAIYPGIGVTARESRLDVVAVIDQVNAAREAGINGVVLFDLNRTLAYEILPVLRRGTFADTTHATQEPDTDEKD